VGVGKSSTGQHAAGLLRTAAVPHALVDLAWIADSWPRPPDDPWNEEVAHRNLACVWSNFRDAGAGRLILCRVLETRSQLSRIADAVPGAEIVVVALRAPLAVVHARIRSREAHPQWFLDAATRLVPRMDQSLVADYTIETEHQPVADTAAEVLRVIGWLDPTPGQ